MYPLSSLNPRIYSIPGFQTCFHDFQLQDPDLHRDFRLKPKSHRSKNRLDRLLSPAGWGSSPGSCCRRNRGRRQGNWPGGCCTRSSSSPARLNETKKLWTKPPATATVVPLFQGTSGSGTEPRQQLQYYALSSRIKQNFPETFLT